MTRVVVVVVVLVLVHVLVLGACSFQGAGRVEDAGPADDAEDRDPSLEAGDLVDAPVAPFDLSTCPSGYVAVAGAPSRYRIADDQTMSFWQRHDACLHDLPGRTHLAALDDASEAAALRTAVSGSALAMRYFVGVVQERSPSQPDARWILLTGRDAAANLWATLGGIAQPDDNTPPENAEENVAALTKEAAASGGVLLDVDGRAPYGGICECDGVDLAQRAIDAINDDPNHP